MDGMEWVRESWLDTLALTEDWFESRDGKEDIEMAAAVAQETQRIIYRCKTCKHTWAHDYQVEGKLLIRRPTPGPDDINQHPFSLAQWDAKSCPSCHSGNVKASQVVGESSHKHCNERCEEATSAVCNCSCGGKNHGRAYLE